jgi:peptidoglycan/LPS O-acetylase OafA/YrhL
VSNERDKVRLSGHLPGLDGVRGVAIVMVMLVHFVGDAAAQTTLQRLVVKAASYGSLGVDLFFILSGFLITNLLYETKGAKHYFRDFYARRTLRIFPLYYFTLAMLFLFLPAIVTPTPLLERSRQQQIWLWTYTANFYIAAKSSWGALTYVNHFWSLAIEEHFYLVWPLVVFSFRREVLERICLAVIAVGLVLRIALSLAGVSELSISVLTPCRVDTLIVGALLALMARREPGAATELVRRAGRAAVVLGAVVFAISAWCATTELFLPVLHQVRNTLYALFFGAVTLLSLRPASDWFARVLQGSMLRFFGKYSYGLYVYHGLLTWYFAETRFGARLDALLGNHWLAMIGRAAIGFAVSTVVAVISFHLFEKRFLALKGFFEPREHAERPPALAIDRGQG